MCFSFQSLQEARQAQEKQKLLSKQNEEKEKREKLDALNKLKEARAAEKEARRLEDDRKQQVHSKNFHLRLVSMKICILDGLVIIYLPRYFSRTKVNLVTFCTLIF
jgi:hypothetical protein